MSVLLRALAVLKPALKDKEVKKLLVFTVATLALSILGIYFITLWREGFYEALTNKNIPKFAWSLATFALVAGVVVLAKGFKDYFLKLLEFRAMEVLYGKYTTDVIWTEKELPPTTEQRLIQDTALVPRIAGLLAFGILEAGTNVIIYGVATISIAPWFTLPVLLAYVGFGLYFAKRIGKPLTQLDVQQQQRNANLYRELITWLAKKGPAPSLEQVKRNWLIIAKRTKLLGFFSSSHGQLANIIPLALLSPLYFSGAIVFGKLFSIADQAGRLVDALSYLIERREEINLLDASMKRIEEIPDDK